MIDCIYLVIGHDFMWTYPTVIQMLEDKFFFLCFDIRLHNLKHHVPDTYDWKQTFAKKSR